MIICYIVPEIWRVTDVIFIFHFGLFFAQKNTSATAWKIKIKKTPGNITILHIIKNYGQMMYGSWDMVCDGQTDERKKWQIEVGVPPENAGKLMSSAAFFGKIYFANWKLLIKFRFNGIYNFQIPLGILKYFAKGFSLSFTTTYYKTRIRNTEHLRNTPEQCGGTREQQRNTPEYQRNTNPT